ncbi:MAG: PaaI family thioesterase [Syntrophales bacterium]|nr:PaaI family thioesterase [Syntrophales bacterium]
MTARNGMNPSALCDVIDSGYEERVFERFRRQAFLRVIGAELVRVLPGYCTLHLQYREDLAHEPGRFHPGVIGTLAAGAGECAALSFLPPDSTLAMIDHTLNLLAPAEGDVLVAQAKVVKSAQTMTVCMVEMYVRGNPSRNLCAMALMTWVPG